MKINFTTNELSKYYIEHLDKCFDLSEKNISKIDEYIKKMDGMTGIKTRHFYNNLLNLPDTRYLEIGSWKGSSICSGMIENSTNIVCIDNWSEFGSVKNDFIENIEKYKGNNNLKFIESDCFNIDISTLGKFNIYLYDGNHSYDSHYKSLVYYYDVFDDIFIFIVDDWNWSEVRNATNDSIKFLNLEILYQKEILHSYDNSTTKDDLNWWNGISVFLLKKNDSKINSIVFNSSNSITDLCKLGINYPTDKSPYNNQNHLHKHPYTSIYDFIFSTIRYNKIKIAEIGIYNNNSIKCWRDYFPNAEIFGFEFNPEFLENAINSNLFNTTYSFINVKDKTSIEDVLSKHGKFDIIIDDSTHEFDDQINICEISHKHLNTGGILIIEDIFNKESEERYKQSLESVKKYYSSILFVNANHTLKYSPGWDNDKLLIMFRNDK